MRLGELKRLLLLKISTNFNSEMNENFCLYAFIVFFDVNYNYFSVEKKSELDRLEVQYYALAKVTRKFLALAKVRKKRSCTVIRSC